MPFSARNLRPSAFAQKQEKFLKNFEKKSKEKSKKIKKRFENIAEKFSTKNTPFALNKLEKQEKKHQEKKKSQNAEKIQKNSEPDDFFYFSEQKKKNKFRSFLLVLFFLGLLGFGGVFAFKSVGGKFLAEKSLEIATQSLGATLESDEFGRTNILLLGSGGEAHDGGYLTDSIIIASLDLEKKNISMLSIPRDMYVNYTVAKKKRAGKINKIFPDSVRYWEGREKKTSNIFSNASAEVVQKIEKIVGANIHYTLYIDFAGFEKVVDELGGISVNVEKRIYDPSYPGPNYTYQTFRLEEGLQILDGETALKYVRSRHGTSGGDFGRSYRQKQTIIAVKNKAIDSGLLSSPEKIRAMFAIIEDNFWTDLSWQEMLTLTTFAKEISKQKIISVGITNEAFEGVGGFLYDGSREDFNGMSVFLPYLRGEKDEYAQIKFFYETISLFPELTRKPGKIEIYNTTNIPGLAKKIESHLLRYNILVSEIGSTDNTYKNTTLEYVSTPRNEEIIKFLKRKMDVKYVSVSKSAEHREGIFKIFIGKDYSSNPYTGTLIRTPEERTEEGENDFFGN